MRRQLVPGLVVRLTVIKAKTRPGIEARYRIAQNFQWGLIFTFSWGSYTKIKFSLLKIICYNNAKVKDVASGKQSTHENYSTKMFLEDSFKCQKMLHYTVLVHIYQHDNTCLH